MKIQRAIISVSNKAGLAELAPFLKGLGVEIISTGGTKKYLDELKVNPKDISEHTGFPEIMDGRVKTLHPKVHGGILNIRDKKEHQDAKKALGYKGHRHDSRQPLSLQRGGGQGLHLRRGHREHRHRRPVHDQGGGQEL